MNDSLHISQQRRYHNLHISQQERYRCCHLASKVTGRSSVHGHSSRVGMTQLQIPFLIAMFVIAAQTSQSPSPGSQVCTAFNICCSAACNQQNIYHLMLKLCQVDSTIYG